MKRWMRAVLAAAAGCQVVAAGALWRNGSTPAPVAVASAAAIGGVLGMALPLRGRRNEEADAIVRAAAAQPGRSALAAVRTPDGDSVAALSDRGPALLVFVRHTGCCFCRETIADLATAHARLAAAGVAVVIVHRSGDAAMRRLLQRYGLARIVLVRDAGGRLYRAFGLRRGSVTQLFGPSVWLRGVQAALLEGHGAAVPESDPWQMPGVFLVHQSRILARFYHRSASDRPDYLALCAGALPQS